MTASNAGFIEWKCRFCGFLLHVTGGGSVAEQVEETEMRGEQ